MEGFIKFCLWTMGIGVAIAGLLHYFVFDHWTLPKDDEVFNNAVRPTMQGGDTVLLYKPGAEFHLGHLARCADPTDANKFVVGRVASLGGDQIKITSGVNINGHSVPSPRGCEAVMMKNPVDGSDVNLFCTVEEFGGSEHEAYHSADGLDVPHDTKVPQNMVFLVSDNHFLHLDSRDFGVVDPSTCQRIVFRLWSDAGWLDSAHRLTILW
jgi:signal peptidase I